MSNINQTEILLESGTNELEIMEFTINGEIFGINVAKVREIMMYAPVKEMQNAHPMVEGIFKPRGDVITVIDLAKYLGLPPSNNSARDIFIITNFNGIDCAFHVHTVVGIDRISWRKIQKPDRIIYGNSAGVATGIAEYEDRLITILDFEKIVSEICPETGIQLQDIETVEACSSRSDKIILVVEDSSLLSRMIIECLHKSGYTRTVKTDNGQEAWDFLTEILDSGDPVEEHINLIITDIEMPQMDGHRLTKLVKENPQLKVLPVILFSSLINEEMKIKGEQLGADEQITKPEIARLVSTIDHLLNLK